MPHSINKDGEITEVIYWGSLTVDDIQQVVDASLKRGEIEYKNRIEDIRKVDSVDLGFKELNVLAQSLEKIKMPHAVKIAILTQGTLQYGIARMFQLLINYPLMKIEVFTDETKARNWLPVKE